MVLGMCGKKTTFSSKSFSLLQLFKEENPNKLLNIKCICYYSVTELRTYCHVSFKFCFKDFKHC